MTPDPYRVLGLRRGASKEEVRRAYRKLALKHHPDANPGDAQAEERFKRVQQAYEILSRAPGASAAGERPGARPGPGRTGEERRGRRSANLSDVLGDLSRRAPTSGGRRTLREEDVVRVLKVFGLDARHLKRSGDGSVEINFRTSRAGRPPKPPKPPAT
ncbi:DnaJ domain [Rubrobacter radiotolerans]|uniref:DnaJ domain n=1 Tax=Rubrobacter radiotolerans TaxID=42256 RepID=A0A023X4V0_RUBRA|nr:J domain-containing protein [Rubrobacter radiotolerans]AHY47492.1 DnaJ domain [Rubrobacter radiotolerans]SMC07016.1 molecular chaperone DnaJ [Rubrobacter radiotolerans DSM 5868]